MLVPLAVLDPRSAARVAAVSRKTGTPTRLWEADKLLLESEERMLLSTFASP